MATTESWDTFIARMKQTHEHIPEGMKFDDAPRDVRVSARVRKLIAKANRLSEADMCALVELLEGGWKYAGGCVYRLDDGGNYSVRTTAVGSDVHTVYKGLSACSCQDSRFRGRKCKHIVALEEAVL